MKNLPLTSTAALLCMSAALLPFSAIAQTASKPDASPQKLEKIEEVSETGVKIAKPEKQNQTTEKRVGGKVTEVQVKAGKSNYIVKPNQEIGNAPKGTVQGDANRGAQWSVLQFGGKKESKEVEPVPTLPPAPARPAATVAGAAASSAASTSASKPVKK
ncbi:hypothetical protein LPB67_01210 [Undibacterium sp. Jales W-56]|uniref:hypothetical protein n=1 Tax=Undibacterium sp. Jales W-56 TaxID=2897325 RepID=UPI0021D2D958|nr:hypothetical protein [Undibacterium sp. Jales W-56]MCU6432393.1 hypothetical protein [Undibacterium sp. Jales W-56]